MSNEFKIAVVGASGAVGEVMLSILAERNFPVGKVYPLASSRSAGKKVGSGGHKIGNAHLKWAFSEAALTLLSHFPESKKLHTRLKNKFGKGKALSILAHKLGRTVYFMLKRNQAFDSARFLNHN